MSRLLNCTFLPLLAALAAPAADPQPVWKVDVKDPAVKVTPVSWIGFSPDGRLLSARTEPWGSRNGIRPECELRTWDIETKKELPKADLGIQRPSILALGPLCAYCTNDTLLVADGIRLRLRRPGENELTGKRTDLAGAIAGVWSVGGKGVLTLWVASDGGLAFIWSSRLVYQPLPAKQGSDPSH